MFDIGFWEVLLIVILALVIIGPERLPGAARKAGYWFGRARRFIEGVRNEVESQVDLGEFKRLLHNQEIQINELQRKLQNGATKLGDIQSDVKDEILTSISDKSTPTDDALSNTEKQSSAITDIETSIETSAESTAEGHKEKEKAHSKDGTQKEGGK